MWGSYDVYDDTGVTVVIGVDGPDVVWELANFNWNIQVFVESLNESSPFNAHRVHIFQRGYSVYSDLWSVVSYDPENAWLVEGQTWNHTGDHTVPEHHVGSGEVASINFSVQLWWDIVALNDSIIASVSYSTENTTMTLHQATVSNPEPYPIPGFPVEALVGGLLLVLCWVLIRQRYTHTD